MRQFQDNMREKASKIEHPQATIETPRSIDSTSCAPGIKHSQHLTGNRGMEAELTEAPLSFKQKEAFAGQISTRAASLPALVQRMLLQVKR